MTSDDLKQLVRDQLDRLGISQAELARRAGMRPPHLSRWLTTDRQLREAQLVAVLDAAGLDVRPHDAPERTAGRAKKGPTPPGGADPAVVG